MNCLECGLDTSATMPGDAVAALRSFARRYQAPLTRFLPGEEAGALLAWPEPDTGVTALDLTTDLARQLDEFGAAILSATGRGGGEPETITTFSTGIEAAETVRRITEALAQHLADLDPDDWNLRPGDDASATVLDLARRAVHAGHHQLLAIGRLMREARQAGVGRR